MNLKHGVILALALAALSAAAGPVEAIAFYGKIDDLKGTADRTGQMVTLDFKLYSSSTADGELLWARRIPVSLDKDGGFYVELADSTGQSYQSTDGRKPSRDTLAEAFARHTAISEGPVWIGYSPVDAKVTKEPARDGLYFQPIAVRAFATASADIVRTKDLQAKTIVSTAPFYVEKLTSDTSLFNVANLRLKRKNDVVTLNPTGAVKLKSLSGFKGVCPDENGRFASALPATADGDCGRVVRQTLPNGEVTHATIFYAKGDSTAAPDGATTIYFWTFGELEAN